MVSFGVHLGRTSMCLAAHKDGRNDVIANDAGDRVTPAIFGLQDNESLVGLSAKQLSSRKPNSVAIDSKGRIGSSELSDFILEDDGKDVKISLDKIHTKLYAYLKGIAVSFATENISGNTTVITTPLEFNQKQREIVKKCAISAGFNVSQIISEPAAAIMAYNVSQENPGESQKCLVFRCGGASLTCSLVLTTNGMLNVLHSITKDIGGDQVTEVIIELLAQEFKRKYKADPRETKRGKMKLKLNAENVKHVLSTLDNANCYIESLYEGIDFNANVSRSRFDSEFSKILQRYLDPIDEVLSAVDLKAADIDKVILCGGTSKIPKLQKSIGNMFEKAEILSSINPDEVIAVGAAVQASLLTMEDDKAATELCTNVGLQAVNYDIVFFSSMATKDKEQPITLIPRLCPIPVRRSYHLSPEKGQSLVSVKLFLRSPSEDNLKELAELTLSLDEDGEECKPSVSAHIHRDGGLHLALTDKASNKCDQVTLTTSTK